MAWLTNWNRRKKLNINGTTTAQTVYQMKVTVYYGSGTDTAGKVYCGGNAKGDFSDIRFTDSGGSTLLNYWIEYITGTYPNQSAIIWVKIPSIPTGTNSTSIYIYYNNPSATTASDGTITFDFFDDFLGSSLDTTKWNIVTKSGLAGNSLSISNSNITITADVNDGYGICAKTAFTGSQAFEARGYYVLTKPKSANYFAPVTLLQDNTHHIYGSPTGNGYYSEWQESGSNNARLKRFLAPSTRPTLTQATTPMTAGSLYNQSLMLDNAQHVLWQINGTNATGQATDSNNYRTNLYAGIQPYMGCKVQVDSAFIRKYVSPEPVFSGTIAAEELDTAPVGSLNIRSNPIGARIFIDSIDQVIYTPITITGISPGTHNITLTKPSYNDYNTQVTILAGRTIYLTAPIAVGIVNGTFDINIDNWTNSIRIPGGCPTPCTNSSYVTIWESGKAHIKSGSLYGASWEAFTDFSQRFFVDKPVLIFDIYASISGDSSYTCGDTYFPDYQNCGWTVQDDLGNILGHGKPSNTLTTVAIDISNYISQWIIITFIAGASRYNNQYYDLLVDNVMTTYGTTFKAICPDTGQFCNASLYIDNNYAGTTPFKTYLNLGTHNFTLFKSGYNRLDSYINITSTEIAIELAPPGINIDSTLVVGPGGIINGTFDTSLSSWIPNTYASWDSSGRAKLTQSGTLYQIFVILDNIIKFDWEVNGTNGGAGYQIFIDGVLKISGSTGTGSGWGTQTGTKTVYVGNYLGKTAKLLFTNYNWPYTTLYVDNISFGHTTGIYNGNFDQGLDGWDTFGDVAVEDWFGPNPTNTNGAINPGGRLEQTFIIDKCVLTFDWLTSDPTNGYQFYVDGSQIISKTLPQYSNGTETIDVSPYVGHTAKISFWCNGYILAVDNVALSVDAFGVSVISYPPGAEIYRDNISTGQITGDTPVIIDAGSDGSHTITLKLANFPDYVVTINITRCTVSYVSGVFAGCATFITNPPGATICIDNVDTNEITPKTFYGYTVGSSHTYSLYLKNYRVETATITFPSDKGILIDKTLTYETGSVRFSVTPYESQIIIDGIVTGKVTPDIVDNVPIGYHTYEIRKNDYYSLTGSFRAIVDTEKLITESLQQVIGIENGTFDTDLSGWTVISSNLNQGYVQWLNGQAHLVTTDVPITFYKDFIATEDSLVFYYYPGVSTNHACYMGWSVLANPDTPDQVTVTSYCGYGSTSSMHEYWGYFEVDLRTYKGHNVRLNFSLNGHGPLGVGGPAHAYVDNVGNISNIKRSITFDSNCSTLAECPTSSLSMTKCYADVYVDNNYIGIDQISADNLSIGTHSYKVRNQGYTSIDTNNMDVTGSITFSQGIFTHTYIDNIWLPTEITPSAGCARFESLPQGLRIYIDGHDTGKVTPATICNIPYSLGGSSLSDFSLSDFSLYDSRSINILTSHTYELKYLDTSYQGIFSLGPDFGENIYVELYGKIQFDTIPEGARLTLDGVDTGGVTPFVPLTLPIGIHTYTLSLTNFQDQTCQIEVVYNQTAVVNFEMLSAEGCIYIDSCPRGATQWNNTDINVDGISRGVTPLSVCGLIGQHEYRLSRVGYDSYTETISMPHGIGINRRIYLNRKIGVPSLDPTKELCSLNSSRIVVPSYVTGGIYLGKNAFEMKDGGIEVIDAQGYDVIHLYVLYENFWMGTSGGVYGEVYIYQSDIPGDCSTRPPGAELIYHRIDGGWDPPGSSVLFDGSMNISKRYIRIETGVYYLTIFPGNRVGDGSSSIFVMEQIPIDCPLSPTTSCEKIGISCIIKRDEGIYSKDRYCYLGEGIFTKRVYEPQLPPLIGTNTISQSCGGWGGVRVECYVGNDGYLVLQNQFSPEQMWTTFEAKGPYIEFHTPYGAWQLKDTTNNTWIVGTGDEWNYGAYIYISGNVSYEIPTINRGHMLKIFFLFPSPGYRYDHIRNMWYS